MSYQKKQQSDLEFGLNSELEFYKIIKHMGFKRTKIFEQFDYFNPTTKCLIELKTRRISSIDYDTTIIPKSKLDWLKFYPNQHPSTRAFFVVKFTDKTLCLELIETKLKYYTGGYIYRTNRIDMNIHYFIEINLFSEFDINIIDI